MQYPQVDPYASHMNPEPNPSPTTHTPQPQANSARTGSSAHFHGPPSSPHPYPHPPPVTEYPHTASFEPLRGRGGFFSPWFSHYLPPRPPIPPLVGPTFPPHASYGPSPPQQQQQQYHHFYRRCERGRRSGRGRVWPVLIVAGAGYFAYRKLGERIDQVRTQVEYVDAAGAGAGASREKDERMPTVYESERLGRRWGWDHHRHEKKAAAEKQAELERKQSDLEQKMKEWEEAIGGGRDDKKAETRWI